MFRTTSACVALLVLAAGRSPADPPPYRDPEITPDQKRQWAFVPPTRPPVPATRFPVVNPVDAFVRAKLEAAGLEPAREADPLTLVRRVTFDLTGLPPTPAEIDAFLNDPAPDAYAKLVDRLLASPHYGERWAQHWLDVVRFAESNGYEGDGERPQAWRYRDYVVRALNADTPFDRFITEQVAGDLLAAGADPRAVPDLWHATGLHRCGPVHVVVGNVNREANRQEVQTEMVNGLTAAVLGLTVGCARCHDHKFDPISLGDYYRLQAFFAGTAAKEFDLATADEKAAHAEQLAKVSARLQPVKDRIADLEAPYRAKLTAVKKADLDPDTRRAVETEYKQRTPEQKKLASAAVVLLKVTWDEVVALLSPEDARKRAALKAEQLAIETQLPKPPSQAWAVAEGRETPPTYVLRRGDVKRKAGTVTPAFPRVLADGGIAPKTRRDLAAWLTAPTNPLTARVVVNRLWQHHFGRGIVATPNDFGTRGTPPTHPELLDWLAIELMRPTASGTRQGAESAPWSLKRMHKLLVCSATYKQASRVALTPDAAKAVPDNALLWRMNRRRLEAEAVRDAVLTAAGTLKREVGGPSVKVPLEPEVYALIFTEDEPAGLWPVTPDARQHTRRSLYLFGKRNVRLPLLEAFDQPDTVNSCAARPVSTFAPQALILMNGPFTHEQSKWMADAVARTAGADPKARVIAAYRRALGRLPRDAELQEAQGFLDRSPGAEGLADLCLVLFNTNEFVYVP